MNEINLIESDIKAEWVEELQRIANNSDVGGLEPADIVRRASLKSSPLHSFFCWDDNEAARLYRLEQARGLIRKISIRFINRDEDEQKTRMFINVKVPSGDGLISVYAPIGRVLSNEELRGQMLADAKREMLSFRRKYATLQELTGVISAMATFTNIGKV